MQVVVMSDSHGRDDQIKAVIRQECEADFYLHCGDVCSSTKKFPNVLFVEGNCDFADLLSSMSKQSPNYCSCE